MLHLQVHSNCSVQEFHPEKIRKEHIEITMAPGDHMVQEKKGEGEGKWLTRSSTSENSGVLRVLSGSAGLRMRISSVRGGRCLMKKYLHEEEDSETFSRRVRGSGVHHSRVKDLLLEILWLFICRRGHVFIVHVAASDGAIIVRGPCSHDRHLWGAVRHADRCRAHRLLWRLLIVARGQVLGCALRGDG